MPIPALNLDEIAKIKETAAFYKISVADYVREIMRYAIEHDEAERKKRKMIHERFENLEEASPEESAEILALIDSMTEEDHEVVRVDRIYV